MKIFQKFVPMFTSVIRSYVKLQDAVQTNALHRTRLSDSDLKEDRDRDDIIRPKIFNCFGLVSIYDV